MNVKDEYCGICGSWHGKNIIPTAQHFTNFLLYYLKLGIEVIKEWFWTIKYK